MATAPSPPLRQHTLAVGTTRVAVVGTIQGLAGESRHVQEAWAALGHPDAIALGVPPEDVTNLKRIGAEGVDSFMEQEFDTGSYEDTLLPQLARFGDIAMPPDDLLHAENLAREAGVPLVPLDMADEAHADAYAHFVTGFQMIRGQSRQKRWVGRRAPEAETPEQLVLEHDNAYTAIKGYRAFENAREKYMADRLREACDGLERVLVVLPYARMPGVVAMLSEPSTR